MTTTEVPALGVPASPPLPADLDAILRRLRLPHIRRHAPEVLATAKSQRWDPAEVLRALTVDYDSTARLLIWNLRFPRMLTGGLVGICLSLSGCIL